jgi:hypothetical protein
MSETQVRKEGLMRLMVPLCLLVAFVAGGAKLPDELNARTVERLLKAKDQKDTSAYPLAQKVLLDMAGQHYRYLREARVAAFEYVRGTTDTRALPLVQEIAKLPSTYGDSPGDILDAYAIREALKTLFILGCEDTAELSRRHIFSDPLVGLMAINNLTQLEDWQSTTAIEQLFCSMAPVAANHVQLAEAAKFLELSPETSRSICTCMDKVEVAFKDRIGVSLKEAGSVFYDQLGNSIAVLRSRLECG